MTLPILYSLRNCPYAMRARIAIYKAEQKIILRDIVLSNKPQAMLTASPKGTVPVLVLGLDSTLSQSSVIEESLEIMLWSLQQSDPHNLLHSGDTNALPQMLTLIAQFDHQFKTKLEQYKCAKRYREDTLLARREACQPYLQDLEQRLTEHQFAVSGKESLADIAILPFIRQFARVERQWYTQAPYPHLQYWLKLHLTSVLFSKAMIKHPLWLDHQQSFLIGE